MEKYTATPSQITKPDGSIVTTDDPLSWIFHEPLKGAIVDLAAGYYPAPGKPITKTRPTMIAGPSDPETPARILRGMQDTLYFAHAPECRDITFHNLLIDGSWRSAIMFGATPPTTYDGFSFHNCRIEGGWDFAKREGLATKWGVMAHRTNNFAWHGGSIRGIRDEHCFYFHNTGPKRHVIADAELGPAGRTLVQVVGRPTENGGSPSEAPFDLVRVKGISAGLTDGGHAFTFSSQRGRLVLRDVTYQHGFDAMLAEYIGTGALVVWPEYNNTPAHPGMPNGDVFVIGCDFRFAPGYGKAPVIRVSACDRFVIGTTRVEAGANGIALDVNPTEGGMAGAKFPCKELGFLKDAVILGRTLVGGMLLKASA